MMSKQFILGLIGLSSVTACLTWWFSGVVGGFHLFEKLPEKIKKAWRVYAALTLLTGGGVAGVAGMRGCGGFAAAMAQPAPIPTSHLRRKAVKLVAPLDVLGGLRLQRTKEEREEKKKAEAEARRLARQPFTVKWATLSLSSNVNFVGTGPITQVGSRKGPFCRVTCEFHHHGNADVEVDGSYCNAKVIPPDAEMVPGWARTSDGLYEFKSNWPGPANPQHGLDSYNLYWTEKLGK